MAYTYEDFEKYLQESGLSGQFSQHDLGLAQTNPDAGMSLLSAKQGYANATTAEDKARYNEQANSIRSSYGNYTGGDDGLEYNLQAPLNNPSTATRPTFTQNVTAPTVQPYTSPAFVDTAVAPADFVSPYSAQIDELISEIANRDPFSYDYQTDPSYQSYKQQYTREGDRALRDSMASAATMTGGIPSTAAITAGQQAQDYYNAQIADKIPELKQMAYNMWLNDLSQKRNDVSMLQGQDDTLYSRHRDDVSDYQTDRAFNRGVFESDRAFDRSVYENDRSFDRSAYESDRGFEWNQFLQDTANWENDRTFNQGVDETKWSQAYNLWQTLGYLDDESAATLGLPTGTRTADYDVTLRQLAAKAAKASGGGGSGSRTAYNNSAALANATADQLAYYSKVKQTIADLGYTGDKAYQWVAGSPALYKRNMGDDLYNALLAEYSGVGTGSMLSEKDAWAAYKAMGYASPEVAQALGMYGVQTGDYYGNDNPSQGLEDDKALALYKWQLEQGGGTSGSTGLSSNGKAVNSRLSSMAADYEDKSTMESVLNAAYNSNSITYDDLIILAALYGIDIEG